MKALQYGNKEEISLFPSMHWWSVSSTPIPQTCIYCQPIHYHFYYLSFFNGLNWLCLMKLDQKDDPLRSIVWSENNQLVWFFFHGLVVTCFAGLKRSSVAVKFLVPLAMSTLQKHHKCLTAIVDLERCCKCGRKKTKGKKGLAFSSLWLWQILKWHSYAFIGVIYCCSGGRTSCIPQILLC